MNKIEIRNHITSFGYEREGFCIDGRPLYKYINEWLSENSELLKSISPADDLAICWTNEYDFAGDAKFIEFVLRQNSAITPILSCPEDFDFSCIVIVADIVKCDDKVIWKRIGQVNHAAESYDQEKLSGIRYAEAYSEEDWTEELYSRRINYTFPYYQNENNIEWFATCNFAFDKQAYDTLVKDCYKK